MRKMSWLVLKQDFSRHLRILQCIEPMIDTNSLLIIYIMRSYATRFINLLIFLLILRKRNIFNGNTFGDTKTCESYIYGGSYKKKIAFSLQFTVLTLLREIPSKMGSNFDISSVSLVRIRQIY